MIVHVLREAPPLDLARALERFEAQFNYPLGHGRFFRISHGDDYPRFFRAMGEGVCFVVTRQEEVLAVIAAAIRSLRLPSGEEQPVVYLGDLKTSPAARSGQLLLRLAQAVRQWVAGRTQMAFGVVMDGTPVTPARYTGRLGIPRFQELGKIMVLQLNTMDTDTDRGQQWETNVGSGYSCYLRLVSGHYASMGGFPVERSSTEPLWLMAPNGRACGRLEDALLAKRLIADDGVEMRSAHLSCFAYQTVPVGVELLQLARRRAAKLAFSSLFVAVAASEAQAFCRALEGATITVAPATVFGTGLTPGAIWNINTAEI